MKVLFYRIVLPFRAFFSKAGMAFLMFLLGAQVSVARKLLSINDAISLGQQNSLNAMIARLNFMSDYWSYKSFRAQLLPAVNLRGNLLQFNHSMVEVRNYENGEISLRQDNSMSNSLSLSIDQNVVPLGGTLSVQSYLYRLDQFNYGYRTYDSQPLRIVYSQPLRAFNSLKWQKKTEPMRYELAKREYLENMETVTENVVSLFFSVLSSQSAYEQSERKLQDRRQLYEMSEKRFEIGSVTKNDLLQLQLSVLNAEVELNERKVELNDDRFRLFSFLRILNYDDIELMVPSDVPQIEVNAETVVQKALENSKHVLSQQLSILDSEKNLKEAKAAKGLQVQLNGEVGFSKVANHFSDAFRNMQNSEIVGVTFSLPLFDWGVSKGRVRMAKANLESVRTQMEQEREKYIQDIRTLALKFNMQYSQCSNTMRARSIAEERYEITKKRFEEGGLTVTELNTAQQDLESSRSQYIAQLQSFWSSYYSLRRITLYDWIRNSDIAADFDRIIDSE